MSFVDVEGLGEVDVLLVERIPEMVVGRGDDLVEGGGALAIARRVQGLDSQPLSRTMGRSHNPGMRAARFAQFHPEA